MARKSRYPENNKLVSFTEPSVRVGIYARLSEADGDDVVSDSILNQIAIANKHIEFCPNFVYVKTYIDDGYTGRNYNRPGFIEMMEDLRNGIINCVVVKDVSRMGRNYKEVGELLTKIFAEMGVRFVSINNDYDSINDEAGMPKVSLLIQTVFDDQVSHDISKNVKSTIDAKIHSGEYLPSASSIPYGYLRAAQLNSYIVDKETADIVVKIYEMRSEGAKIAVITNKLNAEGIPSPGKLRYLRGFTTDEKYKDALWNRTTVRKMLTDICYIGHRVHGRKMKAGIDLPKTRTDRDCWVIIENAHPAIVTEELYNKVQHVNEEENKKLANRNTRAAVENDYRVMLRGKLFCGDCGKAMIATKGLSHENSQSPNFIYYECGNYRANRQCCSHYIREEIIVAELKAALNKYADRILSDAYRKNVYEPHRTELRKVRKAILDIQTEREEKNEALREMYEKYVDEKITREEFKAFSTEHRKVYFELTEKEDELIEVMKVMDRKNDSIEAWIKQFRMYRKDPAITRELVEVMVDRIVIHQGQRFAIKYNFYDLGIQL
ncbi:MAG: recombinase family protein [Oscillospiraceae bacterium]|nr:recombinase family protein [Oscillospiraceae bacterium]